MYATELLFLCKDVKLMWEIQQVTEQVSPQHPLKELVFLLLSAYRHAVSLTSLVYFVEIERPQVLVPSLANSTSSSGHFRATECFLIESEV